MLKFGPVKETKKKKKEILANIAQSEINELAKQLLPVEDLVIVVAGDKNKISQELESLNWGSVSIIENNFQSQPS
ncbi:MAG: hypothetical protein KDC92_15335 [Bacteroidetes bacterium]|nr:hypothetical protein [Bacteroidota bacterium]